MGEMAGITNTGQAVAGTLDRLARLVDESGAGPTVPRELRERARQRALEVLSACGPGEGPAAIALLGFASEMLRAVAVDLAADRSAAERLIDQVQEIAGIGRVALGREVLLAPHSPELSTDVALEVRLALLLAFIEVRSVSLWTSWPSGGLQRLSHAGEVDPDAQGTRRLASMLLAGEALAADGRDPVGITIDRWQDPAAALIARGPPERSDHRLLLLEAAAPTLAEILEHGRLLARENPSQESVMTSVDRRLTRLRFDLHDGPQQDVHLLASDLALFREQLVPIISEDPNAHRIVGRLDDLAAQLVALDGDLRRLSSSVQSPFLPTGSLPDALKQITDAFASRTGIQPRAQLSGDFTNLSESQQITLLALIREALSNVHAHSNARHVTITVSSQSDGVDAQVIDDGRGFEPEETLVRAARDGHLGLVGMHERVRMIGGRTQIESRPGGPTVIFVRLPAWPSERLRGDR
jgi:signal transduction histidine kinase